MTWKNEKQQSMWICHAVNSTRLFHKFLFVCLFVINTLYFEYLQSIRTRRLIKIRKIQIRKIWNNLRSRNRYRFTVFVSVSVWFWNIDRFIILICKYLRDQNFSQNFHSRDFIYFLFSFSHFLFSYLFFTFITSVLNLFAFVMIKLIFELQSTNFFAMSIDRKNDLFVSKRNLKKTRK